jgi:hypothetical protein
VAALEASVSQAKHPFSLFPCSVVYESVVPIPRVDWPSPLNAIVPSKPLALLSQVGAKAKLCAEPPDTYPILTMP